MKSIQILMTICLIYISTILTYQIYQNKKVVVSSPATIPQAKKTVGEALKITIGKDVSTKSIVAKGINTFSQSTTLDNYTSGNYSRVGLTHRVYVNEHWNYRISLAEYNDNEHSIDTSVTYNW
jgi:hypothetical protein